MNASRTPFFDHLRLLLTALVLFHHTAITYGGSGGWYWREVDNAEGMPPSSLLLTLFCAVNQSFFMGCFFLLAGYFTPPAFERKGAWRFLTDRLLRLGAPLLVYGFGLGPATIALARTADNAPFLASLLAMWRRGLFNPGPLWFAQALLLFAAGYALWRSVRRAASGPPPRFPGPAALWLSALAVGAAAFLLRLRVPVGTEVLGLQLGYFASYVFLFAVGCRAWHGRWLEGVPINAVRPALAVTALALPMLPLALTRGGASEGFAGGWNLLAACYALWEPLVAWGVILGLLWWFRSRANRPDRRLAWLAERAYTVYIVHPPVLVGVALLLRLWAAPALVKFPVTGALTCLGCLAAATLLLQLPGARKIL